MIEILLGIVIGITVVYLAIGIIWTTYVVFVDRVKPPEDSKNTSIARAVKPPIVVTIIVGSLLWPITLFGSKKGKESHG